MTNNNSMEKLIPFMNQIQDIFTKHAVSVKFDLPQIVIIGGQSAGKDSVLESFVGKNFFPREIVIRRPLILQLITNTINGEEYAEFEHTENKKFQIDEVCKEIENETVKSTLGDPGLNLKPITLKIYSPTILNLTLVNLPELTKGPVYGQPAVLEYVSKENALILAVTPANIDLAECDALKLAKEVDPARTRTIGVITKVEMMGEDNDARAVLENKLYPLSRGYVSVINRNQSDIDKTKSIADATKSEEKIFNTYPAYNFFSDRLEIHCLQRKLNEQLTNHIRDTLPALQKELEDELVKIKEYLGETDNHLNDETSAEMSFLIKMLFAVCEKFNNEIRCNFSDEDSNTPSGGSRINQLMHKLHLRRIEKAILEDEDLRKEIKNTIQNGRGLKNSLSIFLPDKAFENVAEAKFMQLKKPSIICVSLVVKELTNILLDCTKDMSAFPKLQEETKRILISHVKECEKKCKQKLDDSFEVELCYFNADDADFDDFKKAENAVSLNFNNLPEGSKANGTFVGYQTFGTTIESKNSLNGAITKEQRNEQISIMINLYLKIVTKSIKDIAPKNIMCFIIKNMKNFTKSGLIDKLLASNTLSSLMELSKQKKDKRDEFIREREALKEALNKIATMSSALTSD